VTLRNHTDVNFPQSFTYVEEANQAFLQLWPHRYDYLWAEYPIPTEKPCWRTESRHPLSDRLILQGSTLFGVRFGQMTSYAMLDIDIGSPYHPANSPQVLPDILGVLEEKLDCPSTIALHSSWSGGLHIYIPFHESLKTITVAIVISGILEQAGYKIAGGILEVFPNRKPFSSDGSLSLYNGHRLPLQAGSFLLNEDWQPIYTTQNKFIKLWHQASAANTLSPKQLTQLSKQLRKPYRLTHKATKFLNDLNAEIEQGWTGSGQTNHLLGRIAMRAYVFGQQLFNLAQPLSGQALIDVIVETARSLPGFHDYCQHQADLEQRAKDWARSVESSHYYPYGSPKGVNHNQPTATNQLTWNEEQQQTARARIIQAISHLLERQQFPAGITARFNTLVQQGISGATLYKYKDLWHPKYQHSEPVEIPPDPPSKNETVGEEGLAATSPTSPTSLLGVNDCNSPDSKHSSTPSVRESRRQAVRSAQARYQEQREAQQHQRNLFNLQKHWQKMMDFLTSGDPILMREAEQWLNQQSFSPAFGC